MQIDLSSIYSRLSAPLNGELSGKTSNHDMQREENKMTVSHGTGATVLVLAG